MLDLAKHVLPDEFSVILDNVHLSVVGFCFVLLENLNAFLTNLHLLKCKVQSN